MRIIISSTPDSRRHFHRVITDHLADIHFPLDKQWGFQPKKSTTTALLHTIHDWLQHLENGKEVCAVFFDLKKAFDSVPHRALMSKLKNIDLDNYSHCTLDLFLSHRQSSTGSCCRSILLDNSSYFGVPPIKIQCWGPCLFWYTSVCNFYPFWSQCTKYFC